MSWKVPQAPPTALCTRTDGEPMSRRRAASEASICSFIRDVAGVGLGVLDIPLQRRQALAIAGEHGDGVTAGGEPAHNRAARTWTDACDDGNGTIHVCIPSNGLFPYRPFKKDTYQIVRTHACLSFLGNASIDKVWKMN